MARPTLERRFFASTRGRVVALLRRASRTVDELAAALDLTDNAVRAHLATLERDGLVEQAGVRRGASKPAYTYRLTPAAERLFPKAYGAVLRHLLDALGGRLAAEELERVVREAAHGMAAGRPPPAGTLRERVERGVAFLGELGGLAELEERDGGYLIRGYHCPLAEAVPGHPEICLLAETLLGDVVGAPVRECCARGDVPRCCFAVPGA